MRRPLLGRIGALAVVAVAGFLLGSCGGGDGESLAPRTEATITRPAVTATRPSPTVPTLPSRTETSATTTEEVPEATTTIETTVEVTTSEAEPTVPTTPAPETVTVTEAETVEPAPTTEPATTAVAPSPATTAAAGEPEPSEEDAPWAWIALAVALALVAAGVIGAIVWRRRRAGVASWARAFDDLCRRCLIGMDDVLTEGSLVTGQVEALAAEARSLEAGAPDDRTRADAARLRTGLDELAEALESDRALRLGSLPPGDDQLAYSTALIRRQVEQVQGALRPPPESWDDRPR